MVDEDWGETTPEPVPEPVNPQKAMLSMNKDQLLNFLKHLVSIAGKESVDIVDINTKLDVNADEGTCIKATLMFKGFKNHGF